MSLTQATAAVDRRRRIRLGMDLLDEGGPADWRDQLDVDTLNMLSPADNCVLAQLYGTYGKGLMRLGLHTDEGSPDYNRGSDYGFDVGVNDSYSELTSAWRDEIRYETMV